MVDAVSIGGMAAAAATARTAAAAPVAPATPVPPAAGEAAAPAAAPQLAALARSMAASAPVDTDRVAEIKQAIANGTFPILPATIADQMMALRYDWMQHDQA